MASSQQAAPCGGNKLLASLPSSEQRRLIPNLESVALAFDEILYEPDEPIRHVYFPTSGMISLVLPLESGAVAEVVRIGNEGMVGLPVLFGVRTSHTRAFVQIAGEALRMTSQNFLQQTRLGGPLPSVLLRYVQAQTGYTERLTACNTWHSVEQRLARWLLITHDRVQSESIEVTQEFLSRMLGAHRQSVTLAARDLQRAGAIQYRRGKLTILDRAGLEAASCECYRAIQRQFEQLLVEIDR